MWSRRRRPGPLGEKHTHEPHCPTARLRHARPDRCAVVFAGGAVQQVTLPLAKDSTRLP
jgi:hypothetical protein